MQDASRRTVGADGGVLPAEPPRLRWRSPVGRVQREAGREGRVARGQDQRGHVPPQLAVGQEPDRVQRGAQLSVAHLRLRGGARRSGAWAVRPLLPVGLSGNSPDMERVRKYQHHLTQHFHIPFSQSREYNWMSI